MTLAVSPVAPGFGYSEMAPGYGVRRDLAERILGARPSNGFKSLHDLSGIEGLGRDTWSDLIMAANSFVDYAATEELELEFLIPDEADVESELAMGVLSGLFPAISAVRLQITDALRQS